MGARRLPLLLSVPHAGLDVPAPLRPYCRLRPEEIVADGDVGAAAIYDLGEEVRTLVTTGVARAILDMNRPVGDRRKDGIVKTHTCWDVPIYEPTPPEAVFERLIEEHHAPYHDRLTRCAADPEILLGVDCHTMAAVGPPVGPDHGVARPMVCLGDGRGAACPRPWAELMRACLARQFPGEVTLNEPFAGGYITRHHGREMPWLQLELSRTDALDAATKRRLVLAALREWVAAADPALRREWPPADRQDGPQ